MCRHGYFHHLARSSLSPEPHSFWRHSGVFFGSRKLSPFPKLWTTIRTITEKAGSISKAMPPAPGAEKEQISLAFLENPSNQRCIRISFTVFLPMERRSFV